MKTALITGSCGFIGSCLTTRLKSDGVRVLGMDITTGHDITACDFLARHVSYVRTAAPEVIYHLAAVTETKAAEDNPAACFTTNVFGTLNVLELAVQCGVRRVYVPSSILVYDLRKGTYAASKACLEMLCQDYQRRGLDVVIVRHTNVFGPGDRSETRFVPRTIRRVLAGQQPEVYDVAERRAFLYIDDLVNFYAAEQFCDGDLDRNPQLLSDVAFLIQAMCSGVTVTSDFQQQLLSTIQWIRQD